MSDDTAGAAGERGVGATFDEVEAMAGHSRALADVAEGNLEAPVEHCPGWTVADLVWHMTEVHWFWATIAGERLAAPADESLRPPRAADDAQLLADFRSGIERIERVLAEADGGEKVWTWAPAQQDIAFIRRHQVQEAAVHRWDAVHAAGGALVIEPAVAADSISEFLTFSVSSDDDSADPPRPDLDGRFTLRSTDAGEAWSVHAGEGPGTIAFEVGADGEGGPGVTATASDLLLWLYGRVELDVSAVPADLVERFRGLCFTD